MNEPSNVKATTEESGLEPTRGDAAFVPSVDIVEKGNALVMFVDMPGAVPESIDVDFNQGRLSIYGKIKPRGDGAQFLLHEYGVGDFFRSFQVSEDIDAAAISARYEAGVLQVELPKAEALRPRKISVGAG